VKEIRIEELEEILARAGRCDFTSLNFITLYSSRQEGRKEGKKEESAFSR
jgi:hypothetical protein